MSASNGNGHGPTGSYGRLVRLLTHHKQIVAALETTMALLQTDDRPRVKGVLETALALDVVRRRGPGRPKKTTKTPTAEGRAHSARVLSEFTTTTPTPLDVVPADSRRLIGVLVRHGFLKKKGDGYIRTTKEHKS